MIEQPPTTSPLDEMVERVARAMQEAEFAEIQWGAIAESKRESYRIQARAAIAALAPELNRADLTGRAVALKVRDAKEAGRDVTNDEVTDALADPLRVVMKK